jgi:hypothetical protein
MAAIVVPAWSLSIARIRAFLVPARVVAAALEAPTGFDLFDDLCFAAFTGRE